MKTLERVFILVCSIVLICASGTAEAYKRDITEIEMDGLSVLISGDGAEAKNGVVKIQEGGTYYIRGKLEGGHLVIDAEDEDIYVVLNGAEIISSGDPAIYVKKAGTVTVKTENGTENYLSFTADEQSGNDRCAAIYSKTDALFDGKGSLELYADQGDAIYVKGQLTINSGRYSITAGGGSANAEMKAGDDMMFMRGGHFMQEPMSDDENEKISAKGMKAAFVITVNGGSFVIDTADDAVHSNGDIEINGGEWQIRSGDDAFHANSTVHITNGSFDIPYCYEGVEGQTVVIDGGSFDIVSKDDGLNAAGGADGSGSGWQGMVEDDSSIVINGGYINIVSDGDCMDSNGSLKLYGGILNLVCSGNGNTALDSNGICEINGADVSTNDESENGGGMLGRSGGPGRGHREMNNVMPGPWNIPSDPSEDMPPMMPEDMPYNSGFERENGQNPGKGRNRPY